VYGARYAIIASYVLSDLMTITHFSISKSNLILNFGPLVSKDHRLYHMPMSTVVLWMHWAVSLWLAVPQVLNLLKTCDLILDFLLSQLLVVLKPNRIIRKHTDINCSCFHLRVFLGLFNPQWQRQTSTLSIPCDNLGERKANFNIGTSRITQM
jgi:hypothetical protein